MSPHQNKGDVQEKEVKKFDGTGYDKDLVEALERDIISQNPNIKWYVSIEGAQFYKEIGQIVLCAVIVSYLNRSLLLPVLFTSFVE